MTSPAKFAQYACDHCHSRKLKCSRELPKCDNCKPWNGPCMYSRHGTIPRQRKNAASSTKRRASNIPNRSIDERLYRIEESLLMLTKSIQSLTQAMASNTSEINRTKVLTPNSMVGGPNTNASTLPYDSPTALSFLSQATKDINQIQMELEDQQAPGDAMDSLSGLTEAFTAADLDDENIRTEVQQMRREADQFFIPSYSEGFRLMGVFLKGMDVGAPMVSRPPEEIISILVFEPSKVPDRGWVLLFNTFLSTSIAFEDPPNAQLRKNIEWNVWLALQDSSIFIEPSEVKIQALMILAAHGQEISSPSLCWNLISHACRMAQSMGLHLPTAEFPLNNEGYLHRNFLFWSLFSMDKVLSLVFGRPPFLPSAHYENVPFPAQSQLNRFKPHLSWMKSSEQDGFGPIYLTQTFKLSKIIGNATSALGNISGIQATKADIMSDLKSWFGETMQLVSPFLKSDNLISHNEIKLGISFLTFQYHHLLVHLTRTSQSLEQECITSARLAINLLPNLISNSTAFYNGFSWQLLYYPFTAFFVLFGKIVSSPNTEETLNDLRVLKETVRFYRDMRDHHKSARKLEKIAETFTCLAEGYMSDATKHKSVKVISTPEHRDIFSKDPNSANKNRLSHQHLQSPISFLNLCSSTINAPPTSRPQTSSKDNHPHNSTCSDKLDSDTAIFQSLEGMVDEWSGPLDCNFDWFSWESYEKNEGAGFDEDIGDDVFGE